jgi:hypothetical protein
LPSSLKDLYTSLAFIIDTNYKYLRRNDRVAKTSKPPRDLNEILDVLIGEVALTRRKIESLLDVLDEEGVVSLDRFKSKLKEKSEKEKLEFLLETASSNLTKK